MVSSCNVKKQYLWIGIFLTCIQMFKSFFILPVCTNADMQTYSSFEVARHTRFSSYKNVLYNVLRMSRRSNSKQHRNLSTNLHKMWWCLLLMLQFWALLCISLFIIVDNPHSIIYLMSVSSNGDRKSLNLLLVYTQKTKVSTKNVLRMFEAHFWKKYKNVEPRWKKSPFL